MTKQSENIPIVEGTKEDTGFRGMDFCDEYCLFCERVTFNIPIDRVSLCAHCGEVLFPCAACEEGCEGDRYTTACQRFAHMAIWNSEESHDRRELQ